MRITEIRVHGVAEKGPETILDRPVVVRVAGDDDATFYRPRPGFGAPRTRAKRRWRRTAGAG